MGNTLFDTRRAHILDKGGRPAELLIHEGLDPSAPHPFKGNIDVERLQRFIAEQRPDNISFILLTVTSNNNGGQPDSMDNIRQYRACLERLILYEGFPTYGGMAGRDLEALARGLYEGLDEEYLRSRLDQVAFLAEALEERGGPVVKPPGGHGVYVDARAFLPHVPQSQFPAHALAAALYLEGGVRAVGLPWSTWPRSSGGWPSARGSSAACAWSGRRLSCATS